MLNIQVLGRGLIPRGHGIAPKKSPFPADLTLIQLILRTPGLSINYINPKTKKWSPLNNENLTEVWNRFSDYKETKPSQNEVSKPVVPEAVKEKAIPITPAVEEKKVEEKKEEVVTPVVETSVEEITETTEETTEADDNKEDDIIKPVLSDDKPNGNNNYNNYNKKKHNH